MSLTLQVSSIREWAKRWMSEHPCDCVTYHHNGEPYISSWLIYHDPVDRTVTPTSHAMINYFHPTDQEPFWPQHSHTGYSVSLCLEGMMTEEVMPDPTKPRDTYLRVIKEGDLVFRDLDYWHRLPVGKQEEALTIFLSGEVVNIHNSVLCPDDSLMTVMQYRENNHSCDGTSPTNQSTEPST